MSLKEALYEDELLRLQTELVKLQEWTRAGSARLVVVFEGRDTAGKGGTIKRAAEHLNPRVARIAALPSPTERERTQWYFQRYIEHLPAAGEIVLFDRSWYNRAGVEQVMGICTPAEVPGLAGMHDVDDYPTARTVPGLVIYRYDSPLFFANAENFRRRALAAIDQQSPPVRWLVLNAEANVEVDITALDAVDALRQELEHRGIVLALARVKQELREDLDAYGLTSSVGAERIYPTLPTALEAYRAWSRDAGSKGTEPGLPVVPAPRAECPREGLSGPCQEGLAFGQIGSKRDIADGAGGRHGFLRVRLRP